MTSRMYRANIWRHIRTDLCSTN